MSNSIRTEEAQELKEKLEALVKDAGYENIHQFCLDAKLDQSNLYCNLDGTWKMSVSRMFNIANMLGVSVVQILDIFYHKEFVENQKLL